MAQAIVMLKFDQALRQTIDEYIWSPVALMPGSQDWMTCPSKWKVGAQLILAAADSAERVYLTYEVDRV